MRTAALILCGICCVINIFNVILIITNYRKLKRMTKR